MAQSELAEQPLSINFLEGVNELDDPVELRPSEWYSAKGGVPNFNGLIERMGGKDTLAKYDSEVRSIHQSFVPYGAFGFYVTTKDALYFFQNCPMGALSVNPTIPLSLGIDDGGFTLDKLGRKGGRSGTQANSVLAEKKFATLQSCMAFEAPTPPGEGFTILTDSSFDGIFSASVIQIRAGTLPGCWNYFDVIQTFNEGVNYTIGPGQYCNFTSAIETIRASFPTYRYVSIWGTTSETEDNGPYSVYNLNLVDNEPASSVTVTTINPYVMDIGTGPSVPDVATFEAVVEPVGWRYMLNVFEQGVTANRGFNLRSRSPAGSGSFTTIKRYDRGVDYEVTDNYLDMTAEASGLSADRDFRLQEIWDTGSGEFTSEIGARVVGARPQAQVLSVGAFIITIDTPSSVQFISIQSSSF